MEDADGNAYLSEFISKREGYKPIMPFSMYKHFGVDCLTTDILG